MTAAISTLETLRRSLSTGRMATYEKAATSPEEALALYRWNARLSADLFVLLHGLEVTLRNAFDRELRTKYGEGWATDVKTPLFDQDRARVEEARRELQRLGGNSEPDDLVAALSFGFWVGLLQKRYDQSVWRHALYRACRNGSAPKKRSELHDALDHLRILRNRVAHHEPIFHRHLEADLAALKRAMSWCCPVTSDWYCSLVDVDASLKTHPLRGVAPRHI